MTDGTLNREVIADLKDTMGTDFVVELVTTFFEEAPKMIADLKTAAAQSDADGFRRAAHSLKSNASTFGATGLADHARRLEMEGIGAEVQTNLADLEATWEKAQSALRSVLDE